MSLSVAHSRVDHEQRCSLIIWSQWLSALCFREWWIVDLIPAWETFTVNVDVQVALDSKRLLNDHITLHYIYIFI